MDGWMDGWMDGLKVRVNGERRFTLLTLQHCQCQKLPLQRCNSQFLTYLTSLLYSIVESEVYSAVNVDVRNAEK
jgi:hypothetical protein